MSAKSVFPGGCFFTIAILVAVVTSTLAQRQYNHKLKIKFFTDISMLCDDIDLNITTNKNIRSVNWIFPDGRAVDASSFLDPTQFTLSGPDGNTDFRLLAYNLTALNVDEDVFGYYTCVVVYENGSPAISTIRWGLNVDGADFSDLIEGYKESAMVGGIAAACVFLLIGFACLLWEFRFANRHAVDRNGSNGHTGKTSSIEDSESVKSAHNYSNQGFSDEKKDVAETSLTKEGIAAKVEDNDEEREDPQFKIPRYRL